MRPIGHGGPGGGGLARRLFAAQVLIVLAGAVTMVLVAFAVAPGLFGAHVRRAVGPVSPTLARHLDEALATALLLSLGIAVLAALITTLAVSAFITRRLTRPVQEMAAAAAQIAGGAYGARVPPSRLGAEFATLDNAFNRMAATLEGSERRRRELLTDLAHELRTPIATVDSFLEGIEDGVIPATGATWCTMREQTSRLRRLADDVEAVSRAEERQTDLRLRPVDLGDVIDEASRAAAAAFRDKGVTLRRTGVSTGAYAEADSDRLREVLDNLLTNALRHTDTGGAVTVTTTATAHSVGFVVADDGEGVSAEHLPHLFDRFYRADPARARASGGSGIGLSIARALVEAHGGRITADSDGPGTGTRFTVTIPPVPRPRVQPQGDGVRTPRNRPP
jgi:two-component system, OmpR family, sensor histidine kinase BaeS